MATCKFGGDAVLNNNSIRFNPVSSALANLPNGAGTIAVLVLNNNATNRDWAGLNNNPPSSVSEWYHGLAQDGTGGPNNNKLLDDDGLVGAWNATALATPNTEFWIAVVDWPSGAAAKERFHWSSVLSAAESWTNEDSGANNGGNRAGPTTSAGYFNIGTHGTNAFDGSIALVGVWAGTRFTDTDATNLWVNKKTSDWYNHPAGTPTFLVELNTLTPTDIGASPSTYSATGSSVTLTGPDPSGWTFDARGTTAPIPVPREFPARHFGPF